MGGAAFHLLDNTTIRNLPAPPEEEDATVGASGTALLFNLSFGLGLLDDDCDTKDGLGDIPSLTTRS